MRNKFIGTGTALVTPFLSNFKIDFKSLKSIIENVINNGVDYIVLLGTTGESVSLNKSEKIELIDFVKNQINSRIPLVIGIGGNNTKKVIDEINSIDLSKIDGILSVSPYYNKPSQEGIYQHYKAISESTSLPIIIYNVPSRTGSNINSYTTLKLSRNFKNIVGIKEASGNIEQIMEILKDKPEDFLVISGDDSLTLSITQLGGSGAISVIAQAYPKEFSSMVKFSLENNYKSSIKLHNKLYNFYKPLFDEGNPSGIKALLSLLNFSKNILRLPLVPVSEKTYNKLRNLINSINQS